MSSQQQPKAPNFSKLQKEGIQEEFQYAPKYAALESTLRQQYDPQRIQEQQAYQAQYGPTQYA